MRSAGLPLLFLLLCAVSASPAAARSWAVGPGDSIQAAVDRARPGDVIRVQPGVYRAAAGADAVVEIRTSGLRLVGEPGAVIDATGAAFGLRIGTDEPGRCASRPDVRDVRVHGFSVRGAGEAGALVGQAEDFELRGGRHLDNAGHGLVVVCSRGGGVEHGFVSGHRGSAIHLADSHDVRISGNIVTGNTVGIRVQHSAGAVVRGNFVTGNTVGLLLVAVAGRAEDLVEDVRIERNVVLENDRPNPFRPGPGLLPSLPRGSGILNVGADHVVLRSNFVLRNGTFGIATFARLEGLLDGRVDPFVDGQRVESNWVLGNGHSPDPLRIPAPAADLVFLPDLLHPETGEPIAADPDPTDSCYADNFFALEHPVGTSRSFTCPGP